jgi:hypothetical protein
VEVFPNVLVTFSTSADGSGARLGMYVPQNLPIYRKELLDSAVLNSESDWRTHTLIFIVFPHHSTLIISATADSQRIFSDSARLAR